MTDLEPYHQLIRLLIIWITLTTLLFQYKSQLLSLSKKQLFSIFCRLIISWLFVFFIVTHFNAEITRTILPLFTFILNHIQNDYSATINIVDKAAGNVRIDISLLHDILPLKSGIHFSQFFNLLPILQSVIVLPAILIAWPTKTYSARFFLVIISLPLSLTFLMSTIPFLMAYQFETTFSALESSIKNIRTEPFYQLWIQFISLDGYLILIIIMAILATQLQKKVIKP